MNNKAPLTWRGYLRADGRKGSRNLVLVIYTVECSSHVAKAIAANESDCHVIGFPGCYDNDYAVRLILALARHPNVGAVLTVGLGCEYMQAARIAELVRESGRPAEHLIIQETGGTRTSTAEGKRRLEILRSALAETTEQVECGLEDLVIGCECGGSDATSGLAGNPVVGEAFDHLTDAGGSAIFEEVGEMIGLRNVLLGRAADDAAREALASTYDKAEAYCRSVKQFSVAPGNFAGGLTTIEEKSMGAFAKSGTRPIAGVLRVAEAPRKPGLWLLDSVPDPHFMQFGYTNPNDSEGVIDLISAGCQVTFFVTGRGSIIGSPIAPLVKITANAATYRKLEEDMDFDASRVLAGEERLEDGGRRLLALAVAVADGAPSKSESLGHREYFISYKHQKTPSLDQGCRV